MLETSKEDTIYRDLEMLKNEGSWENRLQWEMEGVWGLALEKTAFFLSCNGRVVIDGNEAFPRDVW